MAEERRMFVVWKRPDGFHGASPEDFRVLEVGRESRIWLHRTDVTNFPFRIAGGWQESQATQRLNNLVNLLTQPESAWVSWLSQVYDNAPHEDPAAFIKEITGWLEELKGSLKGDTWEIEIMTQVLAEVTRQILAAQTSFLKKVAT